MTKLVVKVDTNGHQVHTSALIYFLIAAVVLTTATILFFVLERLPVTRHYAKLRTPIAGGAYGRKGDLEEPDAAGGSDSSTPNRPRVGSWPGPDCTPPASVDSVRHERSATLSQCLLDKETILHRRPSIYLMTPSTFDRAQKFAASHRKGNGTDGIDGCSGILALLGCLGWYAFSVLFTFLVTLSAFPLITSITSVDPSKGRLFQDLFSSFMLLLFNVGDLFGRTLSVWLAPWLRGSFLAVLSILRISFVPLLLCCHMDDTTEGSWLGTFDNDVAPMCLVLAFATTNGLLASTAMMKGPARVEKEHEPYAGTIMSLMMQIGLTTGSALSFAIKKLSE